MEHEEESNSAGDDGDREKDRVDRAGKRKNRHKDGKKGSTKKRRKSVMRRRPFPPHFFALEGMSDSMEAFIRGEVSFSNLGILRDPFYQDYQKSMRRDFEGLHFPEVNTSSILEFLGLKDANLQG